VTQKIGVVAEGLQLGNKKKQKLPKKYGLALVSHAVTEGNKEGLNRRKQRKQRGIGFRGTDLGQIPVCACDVRPDTEQGVVSRVKTLCYLCYLLFKFSLFTSISDDVASLKRKGCSAKLVQLLFLFRSQSTQVLVLGMIVDFVGGLDIGA
jgi:hypothetical protein